MAIIFYYMFYPGMIICNTNYSAYKTPVNFKHYSGRTTVSSDGVNRDVNNFTIFFRNPKTLKFTRDYILKNFPNGTNISEFGCSMGQKPYSLLIMLDKYNKNGKYKITGYDFPEVINKARNTKMYGLTNYITEEEMLFDNIKVPFLVERGVLSPAEAQELKDTFYHYFDIYKPSESKNKPQSRFSSRLKSLFAKKQKAQDNIMTINEIFEYKNLILKSNMVVKANKKGDKNLELKSGDITEIDKVLGGKKSGVIIFQNALYHILNDNIADFYNYNKSSKNINKIENLFEKVNRCLEKNGIFVIGNFTADHLYDYDKERDTRLLYQDDELLRVYDSSIIHKALYENGFVPIFYEDTELSAQCDRRYVSLPSVWKKIKEV